MNDDYNHAIALEYAFDSLWLITFKKKDTLYRLGAPGGDPANLVISAYFTAADLQDGPVDNPDLLKP